MNAENHLQYLLTAYLFDNLSAAGRQEVEAHLYKCAACRTELSELRATAALVEDALGARPAPEQSDGTSESEPYSFEARRLERILTTGASPKPRAAAARELRRTRVAHGWRRPRFILGALSGAAAVLLLVVTLAVPRYAAVRGKSELAARREAPGAGDYRWKESGGGERDIPLIRNAAAPLPADDDGGFGGEILLDEERAPAAATARPNAPTTLPPPAAEPAPAGQPGANPVIHLGLPKLASKDENRVLVAGGADSWNPGTGELVDGSVKKDSSSREAGNRYGRRAKGDAGAPPSSSTAAGTAAPDFFGVPTVPAKGAPPPTPVATPGPAPASERARAEWQAGEHRGDDVSKAKNEDLGQQEGERALRRQLGQELNGLHEQLGAEHEAPADKKPQGLAGASEKRKSRDAEAEEVHEESYDIDELSKRLADAPNVTVESRYLELQSDQLEVLDINFGQPAEKPAAGSEVDKNKRHFFGKEVADERAAGVGAAGGGKAAEHKGYPDFPAPSLKHQTEADGSETVVLDDGQVIRVEHVEIPVNDNGSARILLSNAGGPAQGYITGEVTTVEPTQPEPLTDPDLLAGAFVRDENASSEGLYKFNTNAKAGEQKPIDLSDAADAKTLDDVNLLQEHEREFSQMRRERDELAAVVERLKANYPEIAARAVISAPQKPVDGTVVAVRDGLAVLSTGSDDKVEEGYIFTAYRGNKYLGQLKATRVTPDLAGAEVMFLEPGVQLQAGDNVTTRFHSEGSGPAVVSAEAAKTEPAREKPAPSTATRSGPLKDWKIIGTVELGGTEMAFVEESERVAAHLARDAEAERRVRAFAHYRARDPRLSMEGWLAHPVMVPPPAVGDEGLGAELFKVRYSVNPFVDTRADHLSTFAMDVDTASYTRARDQLRAGTLPDPRTVRVEEFVNFMKQDYVADPAQPFSAFFEGGPSPFGGEKLELLKVTVKARELTAGERRPVAITFAIDTSGSMFLERRLDLVRESAESLLASLSPDDRIAIVAYGAQPYLALPLTPVREIARIRGALASLTPSGSTNVEAGLDLAYRLSDENFSAKALNRVILCSDGVATEGARSAEQILKKARVYAERGIYLSVLGFGKKRYNDRFLERLADQGNGNYAYIDSSAEGARIFRENLPATLEVLARDAKIQVDFNPGAVSHYRLLGYENRDVRDEDFRNDAVDAGEVGPGTTVTALYEIRRHPTGTGPLGTLFVRFFDTTSGGVEEQNFPIVPGVLATDAAATSDRFKAIVGAAELAEMLRSSYWAQDGSYGSILQWLSGLSPDAWSRPEIQELVELVARAQELSMESLVQRLGMKE